MDIKQKLCSEFELCGYDVLSDFQSQTGFHDFFEVGEQKMHVRLTESVK